MSDNLNIGTITTGRLTGLVSGARCRLDLPYERIPSALGGNARAHWRSEAKAKQQLRADVTALARAANLHRLRPVEHITAKLVWAPGDRRKRDEDNLWKFQKIACDALARGRADFVGLDLVPDDSPEHFTKLAPRILPPPEPKGMWLDLTFRFKEVA